MTTKSTDEMLEAIRANTEALKELAAIVDSLKLCRCKKEEIRQDVIPVVENGAAPFEEEPVVSIAANVGYHEVRELINIKAMLHREEIKALNAKYGLKVFADVLIDKEDVNKGVKDPEVVNKYYEDLAALGE
jgi:hypothetical protein